MPRYVRVVKALFENVKRSDAKTSILTAHLALVPGCRDLPQRDARIQKQDRNAIDDRIRDHAILSHSTADSFSVTSSPALFFSRPAVIA